MLSYLGLLFQQNFSVELSEGFVVESFRNKGIKDIIAEFPKIGDILEEYGIGCGPCTVGICELKDILEIHQLEPEHEQELMARIEDAIYPERKINIPDKTGSSVTAEEPLLYSAPMQKLVDEHIFIKRWLALIPLVVENMDLTTDKGMKIVREGVDLGGRRIIKKKNEKEEGILFTCFDDTSDIFQVIYEDHRQARNHVKAMLAGLETKDETVLKQHLADYRSLLTEHIKKEDEVLFPWLDRKLTEKQVTELTNKFNLADMQIGIDVEKYRLFLQQLEEQKGEGDR